MRLLTSLGNVAGKFVNRDPITNPQGTVYSAEFGNDCLDDLIGIQSEAGVANGPGSDIRVAKSIVKLAIENSKRLGEIFNLDSLVSPTAFNLATPYDYFPAICLSTIDIQVTLSTANYAELVPHLRAKKLWFRRGRTDEVGSWTATVSGSSVTMPNTTSSNALLAALLEDQIVHGGYTNWRTLTIGGVEYVITNVNTVTRVITVTGTPTAGSQTTEFFPHRIAGSTTTAREFEVSGRVVIATNDSAGRWIGDLRMRSYMQGHFTSAGASLNEFLGNNTGGSFIPPGGGGSWSAPLKSSTTGAPTTDGANGTPRTGPETHSPTLSAYTYKWARKFA